LVAELCLSLIRSAHISLDSTLELNLTWPLSQLRDIDYI
jgi:hypothetical protein